MPRRSVPFNASASDQCSLAIPKSKIKVCSKRPVKAGFYGLFDILLEKIRRTLRLNDRTRFKELVVHGVVLDLPFSVVKYQGKEVELTRNEFRILYYLFLNAGQVLSKEKLIEYLWNDEYYLDETILLVNINRLRKKLEDIGLNDFVKTKRGVGYFV